MDGHTFVSWNLPNLVTVILMGAVGYMLFMGAKKFAASRADMGA